MVFCAPLGAQQEVRLWHAMSGSLGDVLDSQIERYNASQTLVRVVPEHKGGYERTMIEALAAQRDGKGPHLVQVFEVGTAQMMAARTAVRPLWQVLAEGGQRIETKSFLPAVAGYFSDGAGRLVALPFNLDRKSVV